MSENSGAVSPKAASFMIFLLSLLPYLGQCAEIATLKRCQIDDCMAVVADNHAAPSSLARPGCTSFFKTTVTPVITHTDITTLVATTTVTAAPFIVLAVVDPTTLKTVTDLTTKITETTVDNVVTETAKATLTHHITSTETTTKKVTMTVTEPQADTIDVTDVIAAKTKTNTAVQSKNPKPTDAGLALGQKARRGPAIPAGATTIVTKNTLPAYVTPYCDRAAYSSACSCVSAPQETVTHASPQIMVTTAIVARTWSWTIWPTTTSTVTAKHAKLVESTTTVAVATVTMTAHRKVTSTVTSTSITQATRTIQKTVLSTAATVTETAKQAASTITVKVPADCGNKGLAWALHNSPVGLATKTDYPNFQPTDYKRKLPVDQGSTSFLGSIDFAPSRLVSIYGSQVFSSEYFAVEQVGFIHAPQNGTYTFSLDSVDDVAMLWAGTLAYAGWNIDNSDIYIVNQKVQNNQFQVDLKQGDYFPFRFLYVQAQGYARFFGSITAPDGTTLAGEDTDSYTDSIVQFACDGSVAPFPAFGDEI